MKILKTPFKDLLIIKNQKFIDSRGYFREVLVEKNIKKRFPFNVVSVSKKNVIRGFHYQEKNSQGKFISVIKGKILDVVIDIRKNSKTFGQYYQCILSEKNAKSIFIPPGFAHGFQALEKENYIIYSCTEYRHSQSEKVIKYNDNELNIKWPSKKKIVSKKDNNAMLLRQFINI